jgi:dipeptidyl aminopeptidase/acylaminoacyl peptidase
VRLDDVTKLSGVGDPQISPDGRRVAFVVTAASEERGEYRSNIWMVASAAPARRRASTTSPPRWERAISAGTGRSTSRVTSHRGRTSRATRYRIVLDWFVKYLSFPR